MDTSLDTSLLPDAFGNCACCVRESLDAAGVLLDCASTRDETEDDAWHMP
jgi:hypothetical protein